MGVVDNNNSDNVINQLMNANPEKLKESVRLHRAGVFESRTVKVGVEECSVEKLISNLGKRIKETDVKQDKPGLEKLKAMLSAVSDAEKANRGITSSLFHLFSSRDDEVDELQYQVDRKIDAHKAYQTLKTGFSVRIFEDDESDLSSNLTRIYKATRPINQNDPDSPHMARIFVSFDANSDEGNWTVGRKNAGAQELLFYIVREDTEMGFNYVLALANKVKNGDTGVTSQDLVRNILDKKNI